MAAVGTGKGFDRLPVMKTHLHKIIVLCVVLCFVLACRIGFAEDIKILTNQIGYEKDASKRAVILGHAADDVTAFKVIDYQTGKEAFSGIAVKAGPVDQWKDWYF